MDEFEPGSVGGNGHGKEDDVTNKQNKTQDNYTSNNGNGQEKTQQKSNEGTQEKTETQQEPTLNLGKNLDDILTKYGVTDQEELQNMSYNQKLEVTHDIVYTILNGPNTKGMSAEQIDALEKKMDRRIEINKMVKKYTAGVVDLGKMNTKKHIKKLEKDKQFHENKLASFERKYNGQSHQKLNGVSAHYESMRERLPENVINSPAFGVLKARIESQTGQGGSGVYQKVNELALDTTMLNIAESSYKSVISGYISKMGEIKKQVEQVNTKLADEPNKHEYINEKIDLMKQFQQYNNEKLSAEKDYKTVKNVIRETNRSLKRDSDTLVKLEYAMEESKKTIDNADTAIYVLKDFLGKEGENGDFLSYIGKMRITNERAGKAVLVDGETSELLNTAIGDISMYQTDILSTDNTASIDTLVDKTNQNKLDQQQNNKNMAQYAEKVLFRGL